MEKTPQIHGGRAEDYYYIVSNKKGTKMYYSKILDCKIARDEIDASFIGDIKEQKPNERYKDMVNLIDKRVKLEEKLANTINKIAAINDQLSNMGISSKEDENKAIAALSASIKEKSVRRAQFNAERDAILRGSFRENGWEYHGYKTGVNLNPKKSAAPNPAFKERPQSDYKPRPGNFNYHDDDSSESDYVYDKRNSAGMSGKPSRKSESDFKKEYLKSDSTEECESKFAYSSTALTSRNITTKKEWIKWLKENHVDKGGNEEICSEVITAGRARGW